MPALAALISLHLQKPNWSTSCWRSVVKATGRPSRYSINLPMVLTYFRLVRALGSFRSEEAATERPS